VNIHVPEAGTATTAKTDSSGRASFDTHAKKPVFWSPNSPKPYKAQIEAGQDSLDDDIGFRDIRVDGTRILLNGKPVSLRGVNEHAEAPCRTGRVSTDKHVTTTVRFLQDLNANFARLCHYPQDERMTRMADLKGIMVWSEIPVWKYIAFDQPSVYVKAQTMLQEMILRDRDKASAILWSVANETPDNPTRTEFLKNLIADAHSLDDTRLVTAAPLQPRNPGIRRS
jgi:beta-glucuronidase